MTIKYAWVPDLTIVLPGMLRFKEASTRTNPVNHIQGQCFWREFNPTHQATRKTNNLVTHHHQFQRGGQTRFKITCIMDEIGAAEHGPQNRQGTFNSGLDIWQLGI